MRGGWGWGDIINAEAQRRGGAEGNIDEGGMGDIINAEAQRRGGAEGNIEKIKEDDCA
jgi:hypothetical protein